MPASVSSSSMRRPSDGNGHFHVIFQVPEIGHCLQRLLDLFAQFGHVLFRQFDGVAGAGSVGPGLRDRGQSDC